MSQTPADQETTARELGRHAQALTVLIEAAERTRQASAFFDLAEAAIAFGDERAAEALLAKTLALDPRHGPAHLQCGNLQHARGQLYEAANSFRKAIGLDCGNEAEAWNNLGVTLAALQQGEEAAMAYRRAIELDGAYGAPCCNLGVLYELEGRLEQAADSYRRATEVPRPSATARRNLGSLLSALGRPEGLAQLRELVREQPHCADAHFALGSALLLHGCYREGWPGYEWRSHADCASERPRSFAQPRWGGEALEGRTILLYAEQGFGDTLQFVRYVPLVAQCGGRVLLEVQPQLRRLLTGLPGVSTLVDQAEQPQSGFSLQASLMSLPSLFGTTLDTVPPPVLPPQPEPRHDPCDHLRGRPLRVGLVWTGDARQRRNHPRSIPLEQLSPLAAIDGAAFTSLQRGPGEAQIETARINSSGLPFVENCARVRDWADTAAIIRELDLVIAVDTGVAHLAGTLGKPLWVLLDATPDWRWGRTGRTTPWYPTATLFRQTTPADWSSPVHDITAALQALIRAHR